MVSGGVFGAITDIETIEAQKYAIIEYERIRNDKNDIDRIVKNTAFNRIQVEIIKNYLFYDKHKREDGTLQRFNADFYIAQSWHRLSYSTPNEIKEHDILLLKHESMELSLVLQGYPQELAHTITEEKYNYAKAAKEYYFALKNQQHRKTRQTPLNWKAVKELQKLQNMSNIREDTKNHTERNGGR